MEKLLIEVVKSSRIPRSKAPPLSRVHRQRRAPRCIPGRADRADRAGHRSPDSLSHQEREVQTLVERIERMDSCRWGRVQHQGQCEASRSKSADPQSVIPDHRTLRGMLGEILERTRYAAGHRRSNGPTLWVNDGALTIPCTALGCRIGCR
jgi:hypothetical protein